MITTNIKPLQDRVVLKLEEKKSVTDKGIIIPDTAKEQPARGIVVAVGPGIKGRPMTVTIGDKVIYGKYAGVPVTDDNKQEFLMIRETDIFSIYEKAN